MLSADVPVLYIDKDGPLHAIALVNVTIVAASSFEPSEASSFEHVAGVPDVQVRRPEVGR